jgi:EpsD family peptidyl-prolyl cis-trans isomerase
LASLAACGQVPGYGGASEPEGQVVAVVNGEEITSSQLKAEAEATSRDLKDPKQRNELLNKVVDRHLKATAAVEGGLDRNPQFLAHRRRLEQEMLAGLFMRSKAQNFGEPDLHDVRMFILKNPALFEGKQQLIVDRIGFRPARLVSPAEIDRVKTIADAERLLKEKKAALERRTITIDPADLPPEIGTNLAKLSLGEAFFASEGETGMFGAVIERKPDPVPTEKQVERAKAILKRQREREAVESGAKSLWKTAKIKYQAGYGPPSSTPKTSAK